MPIFDYKCIYCNSLREYYVTHKEPKECEKCKKKSLKKVPSLSAKTPAKWKV